MTPTNTDPMHELINTFGNTHCLLNLKRFRLNYFSKIQNFCSNFHLILICDLTMLLIIVLHLLLSSLTQPIKHAETSYEAYCISQLKS